MTIAESVRLQIIELKQQGMSIRQIAEETGVGKNTVDRVLKAWNGDSPDFGDSVPKMVAAHARATKTKPSPKNGDKPVVTVMEVRTITRDMTISELFELLQKAKSDLEVARRSNDGSKDAVMAVSSATKVVTDILKEMGKWCGLNDTLTGESKKPTVGRADVDAMSLSEMAELVRSL